MQTTKNTVIDLLVLLPTCGKSFKKINPSLHTYIDYCLNTEQRKQLLTLQQLQVHQASTLDCTT